jgi:REP element-mobilizing transposase RayT
MSGKFQNKYRISSARMPRWDYGWHAPYFITICTRNRQHWFGEIIQPANPAMPPVMELSEIGKLVKTEWLKTFRIRPDMNLEMDVYVVMPNHFHAIITIGKNIYNRKNAAAAGNGDDGGGGVGGGRGCGDDVGGRGCGRGCRDAMHRVSTSNPETTSSNDPPSNEPSSSNPMDTSPNIPKNKFRPQSKNLASIVRGFKSAVTVGAHQIDSRFAWQPRFHDHIIRDKNEYFRIRKYIQNNVKNWKNDKFFKP